MFPKVVYILLVGHSLYLIALILLLICNGGMLARSLVLAGLKSVGPNSTSLLLPT